MTNFVLAYQTQHNSLKETVSVIRENKTFPPYFLLPFHFHLTLQRIWTLDTNASFSASCQLIHVDRIESHRSVATLQIPRSHHLLIEVLTFKEHTISDHRWMLKIQIQYTKTKIHLDSVFLLNQSSAYSLTHSSGSLDCRCACHGQHVGYKFKNVQFM